jgi:very-short-patch-repair endonuclease
MTEPERRLWYGYLRGLPIRIARQRPLANYIVDFYCASRKIAIEIDGDSHYSPEALEKDNARTRALSTLGINVLRFSNEDVMKNFDGVCAEIARRLGLEVPPR